ncbi:MAG TPA: hypothetical protein VL201_00025 [Patescibacteria group bacterium]|nr:hypothetical protein [Patescibacteria group bacterium]
MISYAVVLEFLNDIFPKRVTFIGQNFMAASNDYYYVKAPKHIKKNVWNKINFIRQILIYSVYMISISTYFTGVFFYKSFTDTLNKYIVAKVCLNILSFHSIGLNIIYSKYVNYALRNLDDYYDIFVKNVHNSQMDTVSNKFVGN